MFVWLLEDLGIALCIWAMLLVIEWILPWHFLRP